MNVKPRTIFEGDNLPILRGLDPECIDLIYLDPPFNSNRNYSAPIGSDAAGAAFKDTWTLSDVDNAWHGEIADRDPALYQAIHTAELTHSKSMKSYLIMMAIRLLEMRRVLKSTGSIYLHCDPTASHYLKILMDSIFGKSHFKNEIVWHYQQGTSPKTAFGRKHDIILVYSKTDKPIFNRQSKPVINTARYSKTDKNGRKYDVNGQGKRYYLDDGQTCDGVWTYVHEKQFQQLNSQAKEKVGYPTQKPISLLERVIKASSNEKDVILDPFCGCATTCIAAERLQRRWVGIDLSSKAVELVKYRMETDVKLTELGNLFGDKVIHRTDIPKRSEKLPNYRTHKHVLFGEQEGLCNGCKTQFPFRNMTIDHIIPESQGGTNHKDNLQILCNACNTMKGTGTQAELIHKLKANGFIHHSV